MRIGFFSETYHPITDGVVYSMDSFRSELEKRGHEVFIFAPAPSLRYKEPDPYVIRFPAFKGLFYGDYLTSVFFPPLALKTIEKLKLDIIHFHTPSQIGMLGAYYALRNNVALITTYHTNLYDYVSYYPAATAATFLLAIITLQVMGADQQDYRQALSIMKPKRSSDAWNKKVISHFVTEIHNRCDGVIAPSTKIYNQLYGWGTSSPMEVIATGVDPLPSQPDHLDALRLQYNLRPDQKVVLFVGRIAIEKNLDFLVRAFASAYRRDRSLVLMLVGDNLYRKKLEAYVKDQRLAEAVRFTGYVDHDQLGDYYALADVFAFPSVTDTQGLVLNEAAHAGLPLILLDRDVTQVAQADVNALIPAARASSFGEAILKLTSDRRLHQRFSAASRRLANQFTVSRQTDALLKFYRQSLTHHRR